MSTGRNPPKRRVATPAPRKPRPPPVTVDTSSPGSSYSLDSKHSDPSPGRVAHHDSTALEMAARCTGGGRSNHVHPDDQPSASEPPVTLRTAQESIIMDCLDTLDAQPAAVARLRRALAEQEEKIRSLQKSLSQETQRKRPCSPTCEQRQVDLDRANKANAEFEKRSAAVTSLVASINRQVKALLDDGQTPSASAGDLLLGTSLANACCLTAVVPPLPVRLIAITQRVAMLMCCTFCVLPPLRFLARNPSGHPPMSTARRPPKRQHRTPTPTSSESTATPPGPGMLWPVGPASPPPPREESSDGSSSPSPLPHPPRRHSSAQSTVPGLSLNPLSVPVTQSGLSSEHCDAQPQPQAERIERCLASLEQQAATTTELRNAVLEQQLTVKSLRQALAHAQAANRGCSPACKDLKASLDRTLYANAALEERHAALLALVRNIQRQLATILDGDPPFGTL
ncbi:hypothetical protein BD626DRAFT_577385 [Schizophyllum amplum]|uniref:Uncharacterized protein n=1 Tax=Schizophyllum amplum TaxID=97359 RepID=A0A550BSK9_9AGAR|nr:hypothetical protein BD626DRAFT_577385 [Auriculariopsis ampla]